MLGVCCWYGGRDWGFVVLVVLDRCLDYQVMRLVNWMLFFILLMCVQEYLVGGGGRGFVRARGVGFDEVIVVVEVLGL